MTWLVMYYLSPDQKEADGVLLEFQLCFLSKEKKQTVSILWAFSLLDVQFLFNSYVSIKATGKMNYYNIDWLMAQQELHSPISFTSD